MLNRKSTGFALAGLMLVSHYSSAAIEEVVVTAQKREQSLQDVSAAVSAVSADRLQTAQINNIEDLQVIVPSIYLGNDFNMAKLFIRGVGANTSTTGSETGVAFHVDGVVVARAEAQLTSLFDLERIEVLRGPQGSLYGRNAVGGSINLITAKPTDELEGYGRVTVGDYELVNVEGAISGPITDRFLGRAAFKSENRGGFGVNPVTGNDVDDLSRQMFRVHLQYLFNEDVDFMVSGEYYRQDDASRALKFRRQAWPFPSVPRLAAGGIQESPPGPLSGPPFAPVLSLDNAPTFATDERDHASEVDPATETETWSITGTLNWQLTDRLRLVSLTNYREFEGFLTQDLDIAAVQNSLVNTGFNATVQRRDIDSEQFSTELRLHFDTDYVNSVLGFFYFDEDQAPVDTVGLNAIFGQPHILGVLADPRTGLFPPIGPTGLEIDGVFVDDNPATNPFIAGLTSFALEQCNTFEHIGGGISGQTPVPKRVCIKTDLGTEVWAIFGQVSVNLGAFSPGLENLTFKFGGRYSEEDRTATSPSVIIARNGLGPVIVNTAAGNFSEDTFTDFTPEIGLEWRASDDMLLYYTYSEGFKAGAGENNPGPGASTNFRSIIVDPEEIENHEFGLKSAWFDDRLLLNISGYFYDLEGQQINKTVAGGPAGFGTIFENAAQTSAEGVELEFFAAPTDALRLSGSVSYLNSEYEDFLTVDPLDARNVSTPPDPPLDPATDFDPTLPEIQLAGNPTRNSPEWKANLHGEFDIPGLGLPDGGFFTIMGDVTYTDDVFFTEFNRLIEGQDSYTLLDFNLRYTSGNERLTADLWVKNATDETVASSTFQLATARTIGVTYMPPRVFGFTLGYRF